MHERYHAFACILALGLMVTLVLTVLVLSVPALMPAPAVAPVAEHDANARVSLQSQRACQLKEDVLAGRPLIGIQHYMGYSGQ